MPKLKNYPLKSQLDYFKPYSFDGLDRIKYQPGEIDFVVTIGKRIIPIEVKATSSISSISTSLLEQFLKNQKAAPYGIVLYGGVPVRDAEKKLLFWPYWGI